jgi:hypothetical protein
MLERGETEGEITAEEQKRRGPYVTFMIFFLIIIYIYSSAYEVYTL